MSGQRIVRVAIAGSVDDGKSTLLGRLLYETGSLMDDHLEAIDKASADSGEPERNLALVTDGLRAERSQKITIDVAYRHLHGTRRRYLIADTPGHTQYTRNMFTGTAGADIAIVLADAERMTTEQTFRHLFIASLTQVPHVFVCVNKMDLVGFQQEKFEQIVAEIRKYTNRLQLGDLKFFPVSALRGDNVINSSDQMDWYEGASLLSSLENTELTSNSSHELRFLVQHVIRPNRSLRGILGYALSGSVRVGEDLQVFPGGSKTSVKTIHHLGSSVDLATTQMPVLLELTNQVDLQPGDLLSRPASPPTNANVVEATVCWMGDAELDHRKTYVFQSNGQHATCQKMQLEYKLDVATLHRESADTLTKNDFGKIKLTLSKDVAADIFLKNDQTGQFILIDPSTYEVAGAGVITRLNVWEEVPALTAQVLWMTGMSGAGKTTIGKELQSMLQRRGVPTVLLDGDELREGINRDLGFSQKDRAENIRRTAELAKLLSSQGFFVICTLISPLIRQREMAAEIIGEGYHEIFVECSLETLVKRDTKGLYERAMKGNIENFTGISSNYEAPPSPKMRINTDEVNESDAVNKLFTAIVEKFGHKFPL